MLDISPGPESAARPYAPTSYTALKRVFDPHRLRVLAPSVLVFFCLFLLLFHLSGEARKMEQKQKETKELFQAAKRRELIQQESGGGEHRTVFKAIRQYFLLLRVFLAEYRSSWLFHIIRSLLFPLSFAFIIIATSRAIDHEGAIFLLGGILTASLAFGPTSTLIVKLGWSRQNREFDYWIMQPIPKLVLILAIISVALLFVLPGLLITYTIGLLLLGLPPLGGLVLLLLVPLVSAALSGLAAFLGCYAPGGQAATMIANIVTIIIGFLSPLFIPLGRFPLPVRILAQLLPLTYAADAFRFALNGQLGMGLVVDVCILLIYTFASIFLVQMKLDWRAVS